MADTTIVNTPAANDSGAAGWVVALIVILAVIVGGFVWYRYHRAYNAPTSSTNINVTVPNPAAGGTTGTTNTTGATGGTTY